LCQYIIVSDGSGKFEIRIGDTTTRVAEGNQLRLDVRGKMRLSEDGLLQLRKLALVAGGESPLDQPKLQCLQGARLHPFRGPQHHVHQ
jgi:hypothetical protein